MDCFNPAELSIEWLELSARWLAEVSKGWFSTCLQASWIFYWMMSNLTEISTFKLTKLSKEWLLIRAGQYYFLCHDIYCGKISRYHDIFLMLLGLYLTSDVVCHSTYRWPAVCEINRNTCNCGNCCQQSLSYNLFAVKSSFW